MNINLGPIHIIFALIPVIVAGILSSLFAFHIEKKLFWGSLRTLVQLILIGYLLTWIFKFNQPLTLFLAFLFMVTVASRTAIKRVRHSYKGIFYVTFSSIFLTAFITGLYTFIFAIPQEPWFNVSRTIPLLGMILGNSLNGISLSLEKFTSDLVSKRNEIEDALCLGATRYESAKIHLLNALKTGLTPILNAMTVVGLVSIPGMMTGQILAGNDPFNSAIYQIIIMFIICFSTFLSAFLVIVITFFRLFDKKHCFNEKLFKELTQ